jgi:hypothetical protein
MKKYLLVLFYLFFLTGISCKEKIDVEKEKEAIKTVFEQEKAAYFNQDNNAIGEFWMKEPSSMKYWLSSDGPNKIDGWDNINMSQKKETEDNSWDRKKVTATYSDFQINIMGESAWVYCATTWEGVFRGDTMKAKQNRFVVLRKVDGKWKYALHAILQIPEKTPVKQ